MDQIRDFHTFRPLKIFSKSPADNTFVPVHMCFGVKFDLMRKAHLVAGYNMNGSRDEDTYGDRWHIAVGYYLFVIIMPKFVQ